MNNKKNSKINLRLNKGTYLAFVLPATILYTFFVIMPIFLVSIILLPIGMVFHKLIM